MISVFRLAIAEAIRAPEVAKALDSIAYSPTRNALKAIMAEARAAGLLKGSPADMAEQFAALLWGDVQLRLLLGTADRPGQWEIARRSSEAARAMLELYSGERTTGGGGT